MHITSQEWNEYLALKRQRHAMELLIEHLEERATKATREMHEAPNFHRSQYKLGKASALQLAARLIKEYMTEALNNDPHKL